MTYDSARNRVVLFGGTTALTSPSFNDTWEYDGTRWLKQNPATSPPPRGRHAMAYDSRRKRVVVFGGLPGLTASLSDTWEYDGKQWSQRNPSTKPSARFGSGMAYDVARDRTVLFGGAASLSSVVGDTWEWDGTNWSRIRTSSAPSPRSGSSMFYHPTRKRVVLVGGGTRTGAANDTWEFDGASWMQIRPTTPPSARFGAKVAYDSSRQQAVLFGGTPGILRHFDDTWLLGQFPRAEFTRFGRGCISAKPGCQPAVERNWTRSLASTTTSATSIAMMDTAEAALDVCGVDLYCRSKTGTVKVTCELREFDSAPPKPGRVLRSGTVTVGTTPSVYTAMFAPAHIAKATAFVVTFDHADSLHLPVSPTGEFVVHWERRQGAWGEARFETRWQHRIRADFRAAVPTIGYRERALLGFSTNITVTGAPPHRMSILTLGLSDKKWGPLNLPFDLTPVAIGCTVYASGQVLFATVTSGFGDASIPIAIPADTKLNGVELFHQFLIVDQRANALGIITTAGARAKIGDI